MKQHHLVCAKRQPSTIIYENRDFSIVTDAKGNVILEAVANATVWLDGSTGENLIVFSKDAKKVKSSKYVVSDKDLKVVEMITTSGKDYVITARNHT
jgi:hypothetical protein